MNDSILSQEAERRVRAIVRNVLREERPGNDQETRNGLGSVVENIAGYGFDALGRKDIGDVLRAGARKLITGEGWPATAAGPVTPPKGELELGLDDGLDDGLPAMGQRVLAHVEAGSNAYHLDTFGLNSAQVDKLNAIEPDGIHKLIETAIDRTLFQCADDTQARSERAAVNPSQADPWSELSEAPPVDGAVVTVWLDDHQHDRINKLGKTTFGYGPHTSIRMAIQTYIDHQWWRS